MRHFQFIEGDPPDGTMVVGVVYYVGRQPEIHAETGFEPIGYVAEIYPQDEETSRNG